MVVLVLVGIGGLSVVGWVVSTAASAPAISSLKERDPGSNTEVLAADGTRLGFISADELVRPVSGDKLPRLLKDATVAIEDERFYSHQGVDYEGIIRAAVTNFASRETVQGGSTITMQLVRNLYTADRARSGLAGYQRKIREAKLASDLEDEHSKEWILEKYINTVPYGTVGGQTAIGAEAASLIYFGKHVQSLDLHEAALLAGLPQAPSLYSPITNEAGAKRRRDEVLRKMAELEMVTQESADRAIRRGLDIKPSRYFTRRRERYFFDFVKDELIKEYGPHQVRLGGLVVHTTIDLEKQRQARDAIATRMGDIGPSSALVSIDPRNGYIRAMASTGDYGESNFNLAAQGHRQPGSAFKTFVLTAAVRAGVDPDATSYTSKPLDIDDPDYGHWEVKTFGNTYLGTVSLTRATLSSDNTVYAQLILDLGPKKVCETAKLLGITTHLDCYPAEGLGGLTLGVTPLEMAGAYATLASGGIRHRPTGIERVVFPDGKSENLAKSQGKRVITDGEAYEVTKILKMNVQAGTGTAANYGCPAAGKTGTTDEAKDAWFVGYTPELSAAVWVGYPKAGIAMPGAQGGTYAAPVWHAFMVPAHGDACDDFPEPTEPAEFSPFFGKYSSTGSAGTGQYYAPSGGGTTDGTDEQQYDPRFYEQAPLDAPEAQPPPEEVAPEAPAPGNGNGNGNGVGNGNGTAAPG